MAFLLIWGTSFVGASAMASVGFAALGLFFWFVIAPRCDEVSYWEDISGILLLCAGVSFLAIILSAVMGCWWEVGAIFAEQTVIVVAAILGLVGLMAADWYFQSGLAIKETTKWVYLLVAAIGLGFAGVLFIGAICTVMAKSA